jgi:hypothetical protein
MLKLLTLALLTIPQSISGGGQAGLHLPRRVPGQCDFIGASHAMAFAPGVPTENFIVTTADPDPRRFIVYVPSSYLTTQGPYPVVFMLHGTGQTATSSYNRLTWDEAAEALDFIAVFPEALPYDLIDGTNRTKWATDHVANDLVEPAELPMADDVLFIRELFNTLGAHLAIDCDRIYASGFSNGGAFVKTMIRTQLADIFAATSSAGGIGVRVNYPGEFYPTNGIDFRPHYEIVGNKDGNKEDACITAGDLSPGSHLPMAVADIIAMPCLWDTIHTMASEVGMDAGTFSSVEQTYTTEILWSTNAFPASVPREYRFRVLRNLTHEYPSGTNYPTDYVPILYAWMLQYTR